MEVERYLLALRLQVEAWEKGELHKDELLQFIYKTLNVLMRAGNWEVLNGVFDRLDAEIPILFQAEESVVGLSFLTSTCLASQQGHLPARDRYALRFRKNLLDKGMSEDEAGELLVGLIREEG